MQRLAHPVVLVLGISNTDFFKFWRNLVIPIGMAKYCVKSGRIPPKSEWLAAMHKTKLTVTCEQEEFKDWKRLLKMSLEQIKRPNAFSKVQRRRGKSLGDFKTMGNVYLVWVQSWGIVDMWWVIFILAVIKFWEMLVRSVQVPLTHPLSFLLVSLWCLPVKLNASV